MWKKFVKLVPLDSYMNVTQVTLQRENGENYQRSDLRDYFCKMLESSCQHHGI